MNICYLCKSNKSKEYTVRGFFDKSKLNGEYSDIPDEVNVHISCSLLLRETNLKQVNGCWEIRGLENTLKYNNTICSTCQKTSQYKKTPFIIHCSFNDCPDLNCKKGKKCTKHHCQFLIDLQCLQNFQMYEILIQDSEPNNYNLKLLCVSHSLLKGKGFDIFKIQDSINNKFFSNNQSQQQQHQQLQMGYQYQQIPITKGGEFSGSSIESNQYHQNQRQQYQQQQSQQYNGNTQQNTNQYHNNQILNQNAYHDNQQNYPINNLQDHNQHYQNFNPSQQKQQFPMTQNQSQKQNQNTQHHSNIQAQGDKVQLQQNEQYTQQHQQRQINKYYYQNQQIHSKFDEQNIIVQQPSQSSHQQFQGQYQGNFAQNPSDSLQKQVNQFESPSSNEGFHLQKSINYKKGIQNDEQSAGNTNLYRKNVHPPQAWGQQAPQTQQQQPNILGNNEFYQRGGPSKLSGTQYYQNQNILYQQKNESSFSNFNNEDDKIKKNYNQTNENQQFGIQNKQEENKTTSQGVYQPYYPPQTANQSQNGGYSSKYQSAMFPGVSDNDNPQINQQQGYDASLNQTDKNIYSKLHGGDPSLKQQAGFPTHDNTYSFTSLNPISNQNKPIEQEYSSNNPINKIENTVPIKPSYTTNIAGRKNISHNVDTNPNGISVDITDQIQVKRFQQNAIAQQQLKAQGKTIDSASIEKPNSHVQTSESGLNQQNEYIPQKNIQFQGNEQEITGVFHKNPSQYRQQHQQAYQYQNNTTLPNLGGNQQIQQQNQYSQKFQAPYQQQGGQQEQKSQLQTIQLANAQSQQQQYQQSQQQQNQNNNQVNNNIPQGMQYGIPYQIQDNQYNITNSNNQNSQIVRQLSQQRKQSSQQQQINQNQYPVTNTQGNNVANFGVPLDRRQSQQQMQQNQQMTQVPLVSQGNQYSQKLMNFNKIYNQKDIDKKALEKTVTNFDQNLKIEENQNLSIATASNIVTSNQNSNLNNSIVTTIAPVETTTKKRGPNSKKGKKETDVSEIESSKKEELPAKNAKQTKPKQERKNKKKQSNTDKMDEEMEESGAKVLPHHDEITKEESQTFQQSQLQQQEGINSFGPAQANPNPPRQGSENNIINNKIESQESMDFQSQTSLGNHVSKQNLQVKKESKYIQILQQQKNQELKNNPLPIPTKQQNIQQTQQSVEQVVQQNLPQPHALSKQPSSGPQPLQRVERQLSMHQHPQLQPQQITRVNSGGIIQPATLQIARLQKGQSFQQQIGYSAAQQIKKKSGPLINEGYKPFFADIVHIQNQNLQIQEFQLIKQNSFLYSQFQQISSPSSVTNITRKNIIGNIIGHQVYPHQIHNQNPNQQISQNYIQTPLQDKLNNGAYSVRQIQHGLQQQLNPQQGNTQMMHPQQQQPQSHFQQNLIAENKQFSMTNITPKSSKDLNNDQGNQIAQNSILNYENQEVNDKADNYIPIKYFKYFINKDNQILGDNAQISNQAIQSHSLQTFNSQSQIFESNRQISNPQIIGIQPQAILNNQILSGYSQPFQKNSSFAGFSVDNSMSNINNSSSLNDINQIPTVGINILENEQLLKTQYGDTNQIYPKQNCNQRLSNNTFNNFSNINDPNNMNISFNPSRNNQQYPISSNQQINFQISSQSINLPSLQNIPVSQKQIQYQQQFHYQQKTATFNKESHPQTSIDQLDQINVSQNNIYQKSGIFRQPSIQNSIQNVTAMNQQGQQNLTGGEVLTYRNPSIQQSEKQNIDFNDGTNVKIQQNQGTKGDINDINDEILTESEESFWEYQQPEDWQHLIPQQSQIGQSKSSQQHQKNKQKQGNPNLNTSQIQTQQKLQNKKLNTLQPGQTLEKDPFFGIDPMTLVVKDFPQGEDEESVFQWWDQIDGVFFPHKIREAFYLSLEDNEAQDINQFIENLDLTDIEENKITKKIPPVKLLHMNSHEINLTENSSLYYLMSKDFYKTEPIPFKQPNYFSVLYFDRIKNNEIDQQIQELSNIKNSDHSNFGYIAIYKLKYYDKIKKLTNEDKNIFDEFISQFEIVSTNDKYRIEEYYEKQVKIIEQSNSIEKQNQQKQNQSRDFQQQKQDLSEFEPNLCKQFIGNSQNISIQQINKQLQDQKEFTYNKNQITIKLKKIITLDKLAVYSSLQQQNFLNKYLEKKQKNKQEKTAKNNEIDEQEKEEDIETKCLNEFLKIQNLNDTPVEQNILSLEYELKKLQASQNLSKMKQVIIERAKKEGDYLELRNLSVKINDYLKWLTIRKNLILGFSDRIPYDSENYFNYESEEKTGINLSHDEIIKEKEQFEKMTKAEQENMSQQRLKTAASELQIKQQQQQERILRTKEKKEKQEEQDAIKSSINRKIRRSKLKQSDDEEEEEDQKSIDEDDAEEDAINNKFTNDSIQEDKNRRNKNRIQKIKQQEVNQNNQYNENSIDGGDNMHESDRSESLSILENSKNKNAYQDEQCDDKKSEIKKQSSSLQHSNKKKKKQKQKKSNKFLETDCCVCFHHVNNENNTVVYCSQCNGSFHKHCYGIDFIPEEKFICKKCEHKNSQQQLQKKKNTQSSINRPQKDEVSKFYQCKICTESLLPVTSIFDDNYYYHPTCLFIFNYAIYRDSSLQLRDNVTHESITEDIKKQMHITCEVCFSQKGLKVKCCNIGVLRQQFQPCLDNISQKKAQNNFKDQDVKVESCVSLLADMKEEVIEDTEIQYLLKQEQENKIEENQQAEFQKCLKEQIKNEDGTTVEIELEQNVRQKLENKLNNEDDEDEQNQFESYQQFGCNYYVHPLCAFLNGMEIWLDKSDEDKLCEQIIQESNFENLQHLGLKVNFKCNEHSDKVNRNYDEQAYYRRFQINYKNICQHDTFCEYIDSIKKQRNQEDEIWNEIAQKEKEYKEKYNYLTKIKLNRKEIEASYLQSEQFYCQNPQLKEQIQIFDLEEKEEEIEIQREEENFQMQHNHQQSLLNIEDDYYEEITPNITQQNDEVTFDDTENRDDYQGDDEDNHLSKRRSRRYQQRRIQQLSSNKNKKDSDDEFGNFDVNDHEYSNDEKKEGGRSRQFKQNSQRRGSQRLISNSFSSLNEIQRDKNQGRRSHRLRANNSQNKNLNQNLLNLNEDEEIQESSFNQGQSSFENSQNKFNVKDKNKNENQQNNSSPKSQKSQTLKLNGIEQIQTINDNEEEFKGIQKKRTLQKQLNQALQKNNNQSQKFEGETEDQEEYELELNDDFLEGIEQQEDNADEEFCEEEFIDSIFQDSKLSDQKGQEKQSRLKKIGNQKKSYLKQTQKQQITNLYENISGEKSHSRGPSPSSKSSQGDLSQSSKLEENMKKKILVNSKNITKNGKIGKGASIFATQTKKRNLNKNIGSKSSLKSIEITGNEQDDLIDIEEDIDQISSQNKKIFDDKESIELDEELKIQNKQEFIFHQNEHTQTRVKQNSNSKPSKHDKKDTKQDIDIENITQNSQEIRAPSEIYDEDQKNQELTQVTNNYQTHLNDQNNPKYQRKSRSPQAKNQTESSVDQFQKLDQESHSQVQIPSLTDTHQQSSASTKYNLRKHQSKNYKGNLIRDDIDSLPLNILNCPNFIEKQRNALKSHSQNLIHNQNYQLSEESIQENTNNLSLKSKIKHSQKHEKNQSILHGKQVPEFQKDNQVHNSDESSSYHEQSTQVNYQFIMQASQQNDADQMNQIILNKNQSQEEVISHDLNLNLKLKNQRRKSHSKTEIQQQKITKTSSNHHKSHIVEVTKYNENLVVGEQISKTFIQVTSNIINTQINNQKESQELLDFDQFEEQDQILNPTNINFNQ